ncbi:hypothetical protein NF867_18225 [Solitalea sp. MAHUQ-68]|uniref:Lipoprotein n=1 Tax=Solitalea agri TaxID=2953739 RepID=A0A9X2JGV6_9SPHI|nr:hypothetical protein [Solitalea agri]MCO4294806.1 hypothetical protein [Solitalea agri]
MKNSISKFLGILFAVSIVISSCSKDKPVSCDASVIENDIEHIEDLFDNFDDDPTTTNCNKIKKGISDFINKYEDCDEAGAEVDEAREFLNDFDCSDL